MSRILRALCVVAGSGALGALYYDYLRSHPFPPDAVRIIPLLWLAGAVVGWVLGVIAVRADTWKIPAALVLILNVPNTFFAAMFALAALMSD